MPRLPIRSLPQRLSCVLLLAAFALFGPIPAAHSESILRAADADAPAAELELWRSLDLGAHRGVRAYRQALDAAKIRVGAAADEIIGRPAFPYAARPARLDLVVASAAELGLAAAQVPLAEIYRRAREAGLDLCPPEAALQLRLDYPDQPRGQFLHVAMPPVKTYDGRATILALAEFGSGPVLLGSDGDAGFKAPRDWRFVFVRAGYGSDLLAGAPEPLPMP